MRLRCWISLAWLAPSVASAHALQQGTRGLDAGTALVVLILLASALLYAAGALRFHGGPAGGRVRRARSASFFTGMLVLAACLLPPLDTWSAQLFSAHMVQHEVLMLVAAPLLVLGTPLPVFLWGLPHGARLRIGAWIRGPSVVCAWRLLTRPASGWIAHAVALWGWHAPPLFRMALENRVVHDLQHLSFIATALMFWTGLLLVRTAAQRGAAVFYLFTTTAHTGVLGAMITLADRPLYSPDFRDVSLPDALQDQQLGGLIMWVPGSMVYVAAGLVLFLQWVRASDAAANFAPAKSPAGADHRPAQLS